MPRRQRSNIPSLVCAFMASLTTGGTTYAFGYYGDTLKKTLDLTQGQIDTISAAFFCAGLFSWIPGLCADRLGTRFSVTLGGVSGATALLSFWTVARQFVALERPLLVPVLSFLSVAIFLSNAMVTGSVFKIISASCGTGSKGSAVGVAKGYVGLGAAVYGGIFEAMRKKGETDLDFLPMAAFFAIVCSTLPALLILPTKQQLEGEQFVDESTSSHFRILFCSLIIMAILVAGNSLLQLVQGDIEENDGEDESIDVGPNFGIGFLLVSIWLGPILALRYIPRKQGYGEVELTIIDEEVDGGTEQIESQLQFGSERPSSSSAITRRTSSTKPDTTTNVSDDHEQPIAHGLEEVTNDADAGGENENLLVEEDGNPMPPSTTRRPALGENMTLVQMLQTPTALLMLWTTTILVGSGTVETNNMGEMVEALGMPEAVLPACMTLFSVAQSGSRVLTGVVSESALKRGVPRPMFFVAASIVSFIAHLVLGFANQEFFFVLGAALSGFAFGMVWPMLVLVSGELFGIENVGANYMFYDGFTSAAGTFFLSKLVAQRVYESHIDPSDGADSNTCLGMDCFRQTHMIISALALSCVVTSVGTMTASRHIYSRREHM